MDLAAEAIGSRFISFAASVIARMPKQEPPASRFLQWSSELSYVLHLGSLGQLWGLEHAIAVSSVVENARVFPFCGCNGIQRTQTGLSNRAPDHGSGFVIYNVSIPKQQVLLLFAEHVQLFPTPDLATRPSPLPVKRANRCRYAYIVTPPRRTSTPYTDQRIMSG